MLVESDAKPIYVSTPWKHFELHKLPVSKKQSRSQPEISESALFPPQSRCFMYSGEAYSS